MTTPILSTQAATELADLIPYTLEGDRFILQLCRNHKGFEHLRPTFFPDMYLPQPKLSRIGLIDRLHPTRRVMLLRHYGYLAPHAIEPISKGEYEALCSALGLDAFGVAAVLARHGSPYAVPTILQFNKIRTIPQKVVWILRYEVSQSLP